MAVSVLVLKGVYHDSVKLMRVSASARGQGGVRQAVATLGTPMNLSQLAEAGLLAGEAEGVGPNDLVLAVEASDEEAASRAIERMRAALAAPERPVGGALSLPVLSLDAALERDPALNLALLSIPGEYVRTEAEKALRRGLHCFIFSDNVSLEDEIALKRMGRELGLLVMGPDCGTAHIGGVGLGFCNVMSPGPIGIVGATGTGIQEALAAIDAAGGGIRCALGTGGRDVTYAVGGIAMAEAIGVLAEDAKTEVLLVLGKPPGPQTLKTLLGAIRQSAKPAVVHFVGAERRQVEALLPPGSRVSVAGSVAEAGSHAVSLAKGAPPPPPPAAPPELLAAVASWARGRGSRRKYLRGLYSGGTLCAEAQAILGETVRPILSNAPLDKRSALGDPRRSTGHTVVDMGEDFFTRGRPHPMIDPQPRRERLLREAADSETAVVLFDIVLGLGAHHDPGGEMGAAIRQSLAAHPGVLFACSVTGTSGDPQDLVAQRRKLREAGALVAPTHVQACQVAAAALRECG